MYLWWFWIRVILCWYRILTVGFCLSVQEHWSWLLLLYLPPLSFVWFGLRLALGYGVEHIVCVLRRICDLSCIIDVELAWPRGDIPYDLENNLKWMTHCTWFGYQQDILEVIWRQREYLFVLCSISIFGVVVISMTMIRNILGVVVNIWCWIEYSK